jgi:CelD/BcsL family acetyltransferase involved in cellulose biosynthesis
VGQAARRPAQGGGVALALGDPSGLGDLAGEWLALAARLDGSSYFQTPDWVLAWWETIARRPRTQVKAWRAPSGRLDALVVLTRDRERLHRRLDVTVPVYANAGSGMGAADHCGWLVTPERGDEVRAWVSEAIGRSALLVRNADPEWSAEALPSGARLVDQTACPRVELPLTDAGGGPSPDFVRQLRRFTRRLEREGVRFEWVAPGQVDERLLVALFDLHAQGREPRGGSTFGRDQLDFHRRLLDRAGPGRSPAAVVARRDQSIVGVLYGFWWRDAFAAYQSGWDRAYARHGLGNVLVLHALALAAGQGARTFDFLRGTEPYKYRFGARDRWDRTWLVPRGPAGALLALRYRLRDRRRSTRRTDRPVAAPRRRG